MGPRNLHIGTPRLVSIGIGGREESNIRLAVGYVWHVDMLWGLREGHAPGDWHLESAGGEGQVNARLGVIEWVALLVPCFLMTSFFAVGFHLSGGEYGCDIRKNSRYVAVEMKRITVQVKFVGKKGGRAFVKRNESLAGVFWAVPLPDGYEAGGT